jgi:hypothetical protein
MKRSLTLTALLVMALSVAACGGSEPQQSGRAAPGETQAANTQSAATESAPTESAPPESARGDEGSEAAGLTATTLQGERVSLGGQGDVTALYFMAGW